MARQNKSGRRLNLAGLAVAIAECAQHASLDEAPHSDRGGACQISEAPLKLNQGAA
jgi:hypothetical protein